MLQNYILHHLTLKSTILYFSMANILHLTIFDQNHCSIMHHGSGCPIQHCNMITSRSGRSAVTNCPMQYVTNINMVQHEQHCKCDHFLTAASNNMHHCIGSFKQHCTGATHPTGWGGGSGAPSVLPGLLCAKTVFSGRFSVMSGNYS